MCVVPFDPFVSICCCWYAVGAPKKEWRHSLANLARTPREGSSANPLPLQAAFSPAPVSWRSFDNPFGPGNTKCVEYCLALSTVAHHSRVAHQEDGSHGYGMWRRRINPSTLTSGYTCSTFALRGPKATDVVWEAAMKRSQDPDTEESRDLSLFFLLSLSSLSIKSQLRPSVPYAGHRRLFPRVVSATVDIAHMLSDVRSPRDAASEILFCPS